METRSPFLVEDTLPQFFRTLKPESSSISAKFKSPTVFKPSIQPSSSRDKAMAEDHRQHVVSDILIVDDHIHVSSETENKATTSRNAVIELLDDDYGDNADDDDCVFVKREKISNPSKGNHKKDPIYVEEFIKRERKFDGSRKLGKNCAIEIDDDSIQCVDDYDDGDDDEIRVITVRPFASSSHFSRKRRSLFSGGSRTEIGESSGSKREEIIDVVAEIEPIEEVMFLCDICADSKPQKESFRIKGCTHSYCSECMKTYVASKLQDGVSQINCPVPSCSGILEPEYCREILPFEVFSRWGNLLCESVILASQKFYCPFKDCSALLVDDGSEKVTRSECPSCFRLFCAQCRVGWHEGVACSEYQSLGKDEREKEDIMLRQLAKSKKWQRCPKCKYYVEKSEGCLFMKCR